MILKRLRARLLAVAGLVASASAGAAADGAPPPRPPAPPTFAPVVAGCPGGCDPGVPVGPMAGGCTGLGCAGTGVGLFAPNRRNWRGIDGQNQPACANSNFPLSDWAYIRRFCGPTVIPGSCYGHFQTKWRRWEDHCAQPAPQPPVPVAVPISMPVFTVSPTDVPPTPPVMPKPDAPKVEEPMKKAPDEPMKPKTGDPGLLLSPVPALPDIPRPPLR